MVMVGLSDGQYNVEKIEVPIFFIDFYIVPRAIFFFFFFSFGVLFFAIRDRESQTTIFIKFSYEETQNGYDYIFSCATCRIAKNISFAQK